MNPKLQERISHEVQESMFEKCLRKSIVETNNVSDDLLLAFPPQEMCRYNCLGIGKGYNCRYYIPVSYLKLKFDK